MFIQTKHVYRDATCCEPIDSILLANFLKQSAQDKDHEARTQYHFWEVILPISPDPVSLTLLTIVAFTLLYPLDCSAGIDICFIPIPKSRQPQRGAYEYHTSQGGLSSFGLFM